MKSLPFFLLLAISCQAPKADMPAYEDQAVDSLVIKAFAEGYTPDTAKRTIVHLPTPPGFVLEELKKLRQVDPDLAGKYLTLIFLKVYRSHLECCRTGYDLRSIGPDKVGIDSITDPLLYEFNSITRFFDPRKNIEFYNSGYAERSVERSPHLLNYDPIRKEYDRIVQIHRALEERQKLIEAIAD
jgi:hypothetical protein